MVDAPPKSEMTYDNPFVRFWTLAIELEGPSGPSNLTMPQVAMLERARHQRDKARSLLLFEAFGAAQAEEAGQERFLARKR